MTLIVLSVVVIALFIAVLAFFLFRIGMLLSRTADDLEDCAKNVENISRQAGAIGPGVLRINETGTTVIGALPLLCDGAEDVAVAKGAPYEDPSEAAPVGAHAAAPVPSAAPAGGVGYLDEQRGSVGYLDAP